jgi:hypothetical protein
MKYDKNPFVASQQAEINILKEEGKDVSNFKYWDYYKKLKYTKNSLYIWLGPGWHWRENEITKDSSNIKTKDTSQLISQFYNQYILIKNKISPKKAFATKGCESGIKSAIDYFQSLSNKKILYPIPTFDSLTNFARKKILLEHLNEPWSTTISKIKIMIKKENIGCIILVNPNNPSGIMYPKEFLIDLAKICNKEKIWIIEDGAYFMFASKKRQTSVIDYFDYSISCISSAKLFPSKNIRVGGLVLSEKIPRDGIIHFIESPNEEERRWLIKKLNLIINEPKLVKKYALESYKIALDVKNNLVNGGLTPMFYYYENSKKVYPTSPIMSFKKEGFTGLKLFDHLAKKGIITLFVSSKNKNFEGVRVNTRAIYSNQVKKLSKIFIKGGSPKG